MCACYISIKSRSWLHEAQSSRVSLLCDLCISQMLEPNDYYQALDFIRISHRHNLDPSSTSLFTLFLCNKGQHWKRQSNDSCDRLLWRLQAVLPSESPPVCLSCLFTFYDPSAMAVTSAVLAPCHSLTLWASLQFRTLVTLAHIYCTSTYTLFQFKKGSNVAKVLPCLSFLQAKMFVANILGNNFDKPLGNVIASRTAAGVRVICKV